MLVWYTGARREEICKLRVDDIRMADGIHYIDIKNTDTGRVKNAKSVRRVPICKELHRLGFIRYRDAMFGAGETLLFPEIQPAGDTKRSLGDVFYKVHWIYLKPLLPGLKRGQAMHSVRHTVATELKNRGVSSEVRRDLLGHSGAEDESSPSTAAVKRHSNETESRYSKASRLDVLKDAVDKIPIVTGHIATVKTINLLPASERMARRKRLD
jgi:integrase